MFAIAALLLAASNAYAQTAEEVKPPAELKELSLEELFEMEVTSVSKKTERLAETPAAAYVITGEDIRRAAALSIPEALRGVPGVEVARVDSRQYAITARGFNGTVANKLLVLMDGRTLYTPLFSGVFWDVQDTFMEDISQIEVIRGPGGTVWGANAVNGIINVLTKSAEETQGLVVSGGAGNEERGFGGVRYGGQLAPNAFFRVYGKYFDRDDSVLPSGADAGDRFQMAQGGFRIDWEPSDVNRFTLQGDVYEGGAEQASAADTDVAGANVLGRWTHSFSEASDLQVRAYCDRTDRDLPPSFAEKLDTCDLEGQHRFSPGERHEVIWGLGYRHMRDDVENGPVLAFLPARVSHDLFTGFIQDEIALVGDRLRLTLGSRFEHNDYTGFEYQPSARLAWTMAEGQTLWAVVSRAVRTPSRLDRDLHAPGAPPFLLDGGDDFEAEVLHGVEVGYKIQPSPKLSAAVATFYNDYDRLRSFEAGPPLFIANGLEGKTYGLEIDGTGHPREGWQIKGGYSLLKIDLRVEPGSTDTTQITQEGDSPRHQLFVKSLLDLTPTLELDVSGRYVDDLPNQEVDAYTALDVRLGWKSGESLECALVGQNLLDRQHAEFGRPATRREVERSLFGTVRWRF